MTGWYRCEFCGGAAFEDGPNLTIKFTEDGVRHVFCKPECWANWREAKNGG